MTCVTELDAIEKVGPFLENVLVEGASKKYLLALRLMFLGAVEVIDRRLENMNDVTESKRDSYMKTRSDAQKIADETGYDIGIEWNELSKEYQYFYLPQKRNRSGHELRCEVVSCSVLQNCQPGHGPMAE